MLSSSRLGTVVTLEDVEKLVSSIFSDLLLKVFKKPVLRRQAYELSSNLLSGLFALGPAKPDPTLEICRMPINTFITYLNYQQVPA